MPLAADGQGYNDNKPQKGVIMETRMSTCKKCGEIDYRDSMNFIDHMPYCMGTCDVDVENESIDIIIKERLEKC